MIKKIGLGLILTGTISLAACKQSTEERVKQNLSQALQITLMNLAFDAGIQADYPTDKKTKYGDTLYFNFITKLRHIKRLADETNNQLVYDDTSLSLSDNDINSLCLMGKYLAEYNKHITLEDAHGSDYRSTYEWSQQKQPYYIDILKKNQRYEPITPFDRSCLSELGIKP